MLLCFVGLEYVGGIPFDILQPVLERCTVSQLYTLEDYNPVSYSTCITFFLSHFC